LRNNNEARNHDVARAIAFQNSWLKIGRNFECYLSIASTITKAILDFRLWFIWSESKIISVMPLASSYGVNPKSKID
jgi:hypothetical protein